MGAWMVAAVGSATTATDRLIVAIGLVLVIAVAMVVVWAYRTGSAPQRKTGMRRQWTVIKGGKRPELVNRSKTGSRAARRRAGS